MGLEDDVNKSGFEGFMREKTELGEAFEFLDNDVPDEDGRSQIDFNTRLSNDQISGILAVDTLREMGILPKNITITRTLKRLSVSKDGQGRSEKVSMAQGLREEKSNKGFLGGLFSRRE